MDNLSDVTVDGKAGKGNGFGGGNGGRWLKIFTVGQKLRI
jgi:hypothetical protein